MNTIPDNMIKNWLIVARDNYVAEMKILFKVYGPSILDVTDEEGHTAILNSINTVNDKTSSIRFLLKHNCNINTLNNFRVSPLLAAGCIDDIKKFKLLLKNSKLDVNLNVLNETGFTTLNSISLHSGNKEKQIILLLKHPNINTNIHSENNSFIDVMKQHKKPYEFLNNYRLQKTIIKNNPENIKPFIKHNLVHDKIRKKYPHLFYANELNLL